MTQDKDGARNKPDTGGSTETPFQRFLRVARRVVTAPKSEVEKHERERKLKQERT